MVDSNQIRINELARELEIKAKVLIDYLPEIGVKEKKTHSSSIDVEHAELARKHFLGLAAAGSGGGSSENRGSQSEDRAPCSSSGSSRGTIEACGTSSCASSRSACGTGCSFASASGNDCSACG